jgi:eukaryotic-like serine/threonine-protein kinase
MTPERFRQIEQLYHAAREKTGVERAALLAQADPELRHKIEALLAHPDNSAFLDRPALENTELLEFTVTVLTPGACLGPYRVEGKLGEGGMGEVFRAVDTRLGRAVAIKVAHERFSDRFEREARTISSLNHPHICTLYDVGPNYLVMELVEGETIAARLKSGPLPRKQALLYASQIASALAEAHAKGIIHRDLKPGNIMIGKSGIKVLDFGLAKTGTDETLTASRMVMGTPAYMAPEQREGKPADARTDIYSFGCVLYEMLTGGRAGVERRRIPSRKLGKIANRCLEQDPGHRWQSVAELDRELSEAAASTSSWKAVSAAAIVAILAAGYAYLHRAPKLTGKDTIVLADFVNQTRDPVFDGTLRQGLAVQLEQSPYLSLVPDERIQQTLRLMGQPSDAVLTASLAKEVCERTSSAAVLDGSIASLGSRYILNFTARNCRTGDVLDREQTQLASKEDVQNALTQIAGRFRARAGEALATIEKLHTPLIDATTPSLEAFRNYSAAWKIHTSQDQAAAIPLLQRAIQLDPNFAMAYALLGTVYGSSLQRELASQNLTRAFELRDRASDQERFFITLNYYFNVTGDLELAQRIGEAWAQTYPRDYRPAGLVSSLTAWLGRYELSAEQGRRAIAIDPNFIFGYINLAWAYVFLNRLPEAEQVVREAARRKFEYPDLILLPYYIAFLKGDAAAMERQLALARGKPGAEDWMTNAAAFVAAYSGHLRDARKLSATAAGMARQTMQNETAAMYEAGAAVREALFGYPAEARQRAADAFQLSKARDVLYGAAVARALTGDLARSNAIARDLEKRFPQDTLVKFNYLPILGALDALNQGRANQAIEELEPAERFDLGIPGSWFGFFGNLYSPYVRGLAYLTAHNGPEAAAQFQTIVDHRSIVWSDPVGVMAQLQLARAWAIAGNKIKAQEAYQHFLGLWRDADADIPVLKQARAELKGVL